jgi:ATP-dependent Clp protease ATP-binding subunit ClpC
MTKTTKHKLAMNEKNFQQTFKKFSQHFKNCLDGSLLLAKKFGHQQAYPAHLFYALIEERGSIGGEFLASLKLNREQLTVLAETSYAINLSDQEAKPVFSLAYKKVIEQAAKLAYRNKHQYIGTEHLLSALINSQDKLIEKIFSQNNLPLAELIRQSEIILKTSSKFPEIIESFVNDDDALIDDENYQEKNSNNILNYFGRNLTDVAVQKNIDPVIGRDHEISRIIEILCRRSKNNPLLLGNPGVGKTAIIEGLAKKISEGNVPDLLSNKKIYSIDLSSIVAGTSFRGEFEARIKELLTEVEAKGNIILFIDEIHQIVGAGSSSGSLDAANILKPALARGEIKIIGATTYGDYRKSIENDPALARRFQTVKVEEPTSDEAKSILLGVKEFFESFHQVKIENETIMTAVELSQKYLTDKFLPDKAIDLIDEASASIKVNRRLTSNEIKAKELFKSLGQLNQNLEQLINTDQFEEAIKIKTEIEILRQKTKQLKAKLAKTDKNKNPAVTPWDIAKVIAKSTGIPATDLIQPEAKTFLQLEKKIKTKIVGQQTAITDICSYLKRAKAGLTPPNRPLASFLIAGPSGVGKTYTAKILAKEFFGDEKSLVRIDMSEFGEKFNASKLIGAPAGYVGYKESGQLTEKIKHRPYSLVLFDEIEKANPEIFDLLLQILDEGYLTDAAGNKIDFKNTIIIMTSNIGSQFWNGKQNIGFGETSNQAIEEKINQEIKTAFKPEFINRLDRIIYFKKLSDLDLEEIAKQELKLLADRLKEQKKLTLKYQPQLAKEIIKPIQTSQGRGARDINLIIRDQIETALADAILSNKYKTKKTLLVKSKNGIITLS